MDRIGRTRTLWAFITPVGVSYLVTGIALAIRELALPLARGGSRSRWTMNLDMFATKRAAHVTAIPTGDRRVECSGPPSR